MKMDKMLCLISLRQEAVNLHKKRIDFIKACESSDFRKMGLLLDEIEFSIIPRMRNLVKRDTFEDWGSVAAKEEAP